MSANCTHAARRSGWHTTHLRWLLIVPLAVFFALFFVIPVGLLFATSFNPPAIGQVTLSSELTFDNYIRFFSRTNYLLAAGRSVLLATAVAVLTLIIAWPMAFVIARTQNPARNTFLLILVLAAMQLRYGHPLVRHDGHSRRQGFDQPDAGRARPVFTRAARPTHVQLPRRGTGSGAVFDAVHDPDFSRRHSRYRSESRRSRAQSRCEPPAHFAARHTTGVDAGHPVRVLCWSSRCQSRRISCLL